MYLKQITRCVKSVKYFLDGVYFFIPVLMFTFRPGSRLIPGNLCVKTVTREATEAAVTSASHILVFLSDAATKNDHQLPIHLITYRWKSCNSECDSLDLCSVAENG